MGRVYWCEGINSDDYASYAHGTQRYLSHLYFHVFASSLSRQQFEQQNFRPLFVSSGQNHRVVAVNLHTVGLRPCICNI